MYMCVWSIDRTCYAPICHANAKETASFARIADAEIVYSRFQDLLDIKSSAQLLTRPYRLR